MLTFDPATPLQDDEAVSASQHEDGPLRIMKKRDRYRSAVRYGPGEVNQGLANIIAADQFHRMMTEAEREGLLGMGGGGASASSSTTPRDPPEHDPVEASSREDIPLGAAVKPPIYYGTAPFLSTLDRHHGLGENNVWINEKWQLAPCTAKNATEVCGVQQETGLICPLLSGKRYGYCHKPVGVAGDFCDFSHWARDAYPFYATTCLEPSKCVQVKNEWLKRFKGFFVKMPHVCGQLKNDIKKIAKREKEKMEHNAGYVLQHERNGSGKG
jgi:hypothetical protein